MSEGEGEVSVRLGFGWSVGCSALVSPPQSTPFPSLQTAVSFQRPLVDKIDPRRHVAGHRKGGDGCSNLSDSYKDRQPFVADLKHPNFPGVQVRCARAA